MDAELKDAYVTQYGSVIKSSSPERLREMLWQQNFGQVRLLPHLTSQDRTGDGLSGAMPANMA